MSEAKFEACEIRQLRYRMGWTQSEMARTVGCKVELVAAWEQGAAHPESEQQTTLIRFMQQAESNSEKIQRGPAAEDLMTRRNLSQIHDSEVLAYLIDGSVAFK